MVEFGGIVLVGIYFAASFFMLLSHSLVRMLLGIALMSNGVNLLIFISGRVLSTVPPLIPHGADVPTQVTANPLPQALILTAIVISFALFAFVLVLTYRTYETLKTDNTQKMRIAEPDHICDLPEGY